MFSTRHIVNFWRTLLRRREPAAHRYSFDLGNLSRINRAKSFLAYTARLGGRGPARPDRTDTPCPDLVHPRNRFRSATNSSTSSAVVSQEHIKRAPPPGPTSV